jgi:hypothetical protein
MVGVMEGMADKYGECTNLEETFYQKGCTEGFKKGKQLLMDEVCHDCKHKKRNDLVEKYGYLVEQYDKLSYAQKEAVESVIRNMKK